MRATGVAGLELEVWAIGVCVGQGLREPRGQAADTVSTGGDGGCLVRRDGDGGLEAAHGVDGHGVGEEDLTVTVGLDQADGLGPEGVTGDDGLKR